METRLTEIADGVHQLTTHISEMDFSFNQYLLVDDAPLLFRLRADPRQWRWGLQFLLECLPSRTRRNVERIRKLPLPADGMNWTLPAHLPR